MGDGEVWLQARTLRDHVMHVVNTGGCRAVIVGGDGTMSKLDGYQRGLLPPLGSYRLSADESALDLKKGIIERAAGETIGACIRSIGVVESRSFHKFETGVLPRGSIRSGRCSCYITWRKG